MSDIKTDISPESEEHICPTCKKKFKNHRGLIMHYVRSSCATEHASMIDQNPMDKKPRYKYNTEK